MLGAASLVLAVFVIVTAFALARAFSQRALVAEHSKLQGLIYAVLGDADINANGQLTVDSNALVENRLRQPQSGLYAVILGAHGEVVWHSPSLIQPPPPLSPVPVGSWRFQRLKHGRGLFALSFGVRWVGQNVKQPRYTVVALENNADFDAQVDRFSTTLWLWLGGAAVGLLLVQLLVLRWGLRPLGRLASELNRVESGELEQVSRDYPLELRPLTRNLNALLRSARARQMRYRNALADLAHSVKTPLAVLRGLAEREDVQGETRRTLREQLKRMDDIVGYQLQRAATAGGQALRRPIPLQPLVRRVVSALEKVYRDKGVAFTLDVPGELHLRADEGDLTELLGNLLDNAAKWSRERVRISARTEDGWLHLDIADDGPGLPADGLGSVLQRGARADTRIEGQGIGLAVVDEIVRAYEGRLEGGTSELGGALLSVILPVD